MGSEKDDSKRSRRDKEKSRDGERHKDHESRRSDREKIVVEEDKHYKEHKEKRHRERERDKDRKRSHDDDKEIKDRAKMKAHSEDSDVEREERQRKRDRHRKRGREDDLIEESSEDRQVEEMESDRHRKRGCEDDKKRAEKKIKDASEDKDVERVDGEERERERDKEIRKRAKEREREDREREKAKEREREDREREKAKERERADREKEKAKERERENKEREKIKEREEKERERGKKREREDRERERAKEKAREREREKENDREKYREREKKERKKEEKEKERMRAREKNKKVEMDDSSDENENARIRNRRDDDYSERDHERTGRSRRHRDSSEGSPRIKSGVDTVKKEETTREEDLEEEQRRLDEDADKRRRRVQEWQELKRKKEESEADINGDATSDLPKSGKTWTLEGESDDEEIHYMEKSDEDMNVDEDGQPTGENGDAMAVDFEKETDAPLLQNGGCGDIADEEEIDPLDAFMNSMVLPEVEKLNNSGAPSINSGNNMESEKKDKINGEQGKKGSKKSIGRIIPGEDSDSDFGETEKDEDTVEDENDDDFMKRVKKTKVEKLSLVDHTKIEYETFRKNFYIEVKEISRMIPEEVAAYRKELELKIHGKDVPKPIKTWHQAGLTGKTLEMIKKLNFEKPMPIQAQTLPIIMSGRDCIGVAKTGSGKTLAFVLPMLRHIKDQRPVEAGDGPIGLIMAPTRELVQQIHSDIKKFAKLMDIKCVPVYGGSGVAQQISELKRGAEIVVCTPGRMIDILCTSGGKITNLRRVTFFVMDEADRMFDMGFEPQITRIVQNTRPDRQTVLFSATFPRQVEILARKVLNKPIEIQVGGRSVVNKDIDQLVEVRPEADRFLRLLELLGEWCDKGKILIFVQSQEKCDSLFKDLIRHGYPCLSLHGAKDQTDRESTISDFKTNVCNLLIATSIAARGLDVKELDLVINYDVPNHYEDYVHRVGRTGRAGRKGCAITFISEDDARYAPDLVKALELCEQVVPDDLKALADGFMAKVNQGLEQAHGTGYGGSGFKFNEEEDEVRKAAKKAQAKEYGFEEDKSDSEDEDDGVRKAGGGDISQQAALAQFAALAAASKAAQPVVSAAQPVLNGGVPLSFPGVPGLLVPGVPAVVPVVPADGAARAAAFAAAMNLQHNLAKIQADAMPEHYEAELEINDFPQNARWKVTHKETLGPISEWTGAAITTRGQFYPSGKIAAQGERKLYLFIEGPTEQSVKRAKAELKRVLEDVTSHVSSLPGGAQAGRYNVL